ncbi:MAG TPA: response regulator, partial [Thermoplasmata archaeon]|nr:response regulator [Thermoplasmata archaeon]
MAREVRVLILEDNPADTELMLVALRRGGLEVEALAATGEQEFRGLLDRLPDVVLTDYSLPGYDAIRAIREVRSRGQDVPVIVVTGTINEETAVNCIREGATDY